MSLNMLLPILYALIYKNIKNFIYFNFVSEISMNSPICKNIFLLMNTCKILIQKITSNFFSSEF